MLTGVTYVSMTRSPMSNLLSHSEVVRELCSTLCHFSCLALSRVGELLCSWIGAQFGRRRRKRRVLVFGFLGFEVDE